ncbi:MAG: hypothetical protein ACI38Q_03330 [Candidatus Bruticola sp.]
MSEADNIKEESSIPSDASTEEASATNGQTAEDKKSDVLDKRIVYQSSMRNFYIASLLLLLLSGALVKTGISMMSGRGDSLDAEAIIIGSIPILLAVACIVMLIMAYSIFRDRTIILTPTHLIYDDSRKKIINMAWKNFQTATEIKPTKSIFDHTTVSDGQNSFVIERFFFPKYDKLCTDIKTVRRLAKKQDIFL